MHSKGQCARSPPERLRHDITHRKTPIYEATQLLKGMRL